MKLCISLATRARPQQLIETIRKSTANLLVPSTVLMVQVDADDIPTIEALAWERRDPRVVVNIGEREDTIAAKWNRALSEPADLYLVAADDDPYITPAYDAKLLDAAKRFPDGIGMVYGHMANASFSGVVAPTAKLCEKLGHIFPEYFPYWFCDHWTDDIAKIIGRISFADVRTDQSKVGKTQEMREPGWWATWFDAAYLMRRRIAHEIIRGEDFQETAGWKELLLTHHPLIEYRSRWINENVRVNDQQYRAWSGLDTQDERYQRVKQRAIAMIPQLLDDPEMSRAEAARFRAVLVPPTTIAGLRRAFA
jgi:hypothetical protein